MSLWDYYRQVAKGIGGRPFADIRERQDFEARREHLLRDFIESVGLQDAPDFHPTAVEDRGRVAGRGFSMQRIAYQLLPDCWSSANLYYPDPFPPDGSLPAVLYVCGHSALGIHPYQQHGIMWARRGYICMVLDTITQNDNPGKHNGVGGSGERQDWISMGYSAVGGEMWNSIRALDILAAAPGVDPERIGVTGNSGGGGHSFFLGIIDQRIKAVATAGGVTRPQHLLDCQQLITHCDCLCLYNQYRHDPCEYAALMAPRALLFVFGREDYHFLPSAFRELHAETQKIYALYGHAERCRLFEYRGPHGYTPESVAAIQEWFDTHLAGERRAAEPLAEQELEERHTSVFNGSPPQPNRLAMLPELLTRTGTVSLPATPDEWPAIRDNVRQGIRETLMPVFASEPPVKFEPLSEWLKSTCQGMAAYHRYTAAVDGGELWAETLVPPTDSEYVFVGVAAPDQISRDVMVRIMDRSPHALAIVVPRFCGFHYCATQERHLVSAGCYTGMTPFMLMLEDLQRALPSLMRLPELKGRKPVLYGRGEAGVAALYHTLLEDSIAGLVVEDIPSSHREGAYFLNVLRVLDIQHAFGMPAPRRVSVLNGNPSLWAKRLYDRLGCLHNLQVGHSMKEIMNSFGAATTGGDRP